MSNELCSILIVDDEPYILSTLAALLDREFNVVTANSLKSAKEVFARQNVDLVLSDQRISRDSGVEFLTWVYQEFPQTVRLLMTGFAELEEAVAAINIARIFCYVFKPWKPEELLETLRRAAHTFRLERDNQRLVAELQTLNLDLEKRVQSRTKQLQEANHEMEQKNKMLEKLALTDALTNLPNRRAMDRLVERELRRQDRYPSPLSIGFIDVDHFKNINSAYLLPGGDRVLVDLAKVLSNSLRTVDLVGRIGGEEFLVIAPETDSRGARVLGERIRTTVEQTQFQYKEHIIHVTVSIGFAVACNGVDVEYEQIKHFASAALSEAKMTGRNRCIINTIGDRAAEQAAG